MNIYEAAQVLRNKLDYNYMVGVSYTEIFVYGAKKPKDLPTNVENYPVKFNKSGKIRPAVSRSNA